MESMSKTSENKKTGKTSFGAVVSTFILCFALWILLSWSLNAKELIVGAAVSLLVACVTAGMFIHERAFYLFNPVRLFKLLFYVVIVLPSEIVKANMDLAKRVFKRDIPSNPGFIRIPVKKGMSEYGLANLCNAITLTPGTISVDVAKSDDEDYIYIHWIDVQTMDREKAGDMIKGRLEKWIGRIWQ